MCLKFLGFFSSSYRSPTGFPKVPSFKGEANATTGSVREALEGDWKDALDAKAKAILQEIAFFSLLLVPQCHSFH